MVLLSGCIWNLAAAYLLLPFHPGLRHHHFSPNHSPGTVLPASSLDQLQEFFNKVASVIPLKSKSDQASLLLQSLQWFPISLQIMFGLLTIVYKVIHDLDPAIPLWFHLLPRSILLSSPQHFP